MPCTEMVEDVEVSGHEIKSSVLFLLNFTRLCYIQMNVSSWLLDMNMCKWDSLAIRSNLGFISMWVVFKDTEFGEIT